MLLVVGSQARCSPGWWQAPMGIKGLGAGSLAARPLAVQCIAINLHWHDGTVHVGRMHQFGPCCPSIVLVRPRNPERLLVCPDPSIFPSPHRNSTTCSIVPEQKRAVKLSLQKAKRPSYLPFIQVPRWLKELTNDWEYNEIPD